MVGDYVLTGMRVGDRDVWRLTPRIKLEDLIVSVIVESSPPRFRIGVSEISFPKGEIHLPENPVSDCGIWIIAPSGTTPLLKTL